MLLLAVQPPAADPTALDPHGLRTEAQAEAQVAAIITRRMNGLKMPGTDGLHPLPPLSAALFAAADTDHDGKVSLAEAVAGAARDFALADSNHDGVETPEERMAFLEREIKGGQTPKGVQLGR